MTAARVFALFLFALGVACLVVLPLLFHRCGLSWPMSLALTVLFVVVELVGQIGMAVIWRPL